MGEHVIKLPDVGEGVAEAELVEWHVKVGDLVREDALLAAVMTDKATVEIPSPVDGEVLWLGAEIGETVAVGSPIVRLKVGGRGQCRCGERRARRQRARPTAGPRRRKQRRRRPKPATPRPRRSQRRRPRRCAAPKVAGRVQRSSRRAARRGREAAGLAGGAPARQRGRHRSAPGRRHRPGRPHHARRPRRLPRPRAAARERPAGLAPNTAVEDIKVIGLRRKIAEKMALAKSRIPHITYVEEVDVTALEELRAALNKEKRPDQPEADAAAVPGARHGQGDRRPAQHQRAVRRRRRRRPPPRRRPCRHRDADARRPDGAGGTPRRGARPLGQRGRDRPAGRGGQGRQATRDELSGSTITITSLGAMGGVATTPIINHPEVAIVGVNKIDDAAGLGRQPVHPAQDDEPVLQLRSPRRRRLGRRRLRPAHQGAAGNPGADLHRGADGDERNLLQAPRSSAPARAAISAPSAPASSASTPSSSRPTSPAAPASTSAASRPRR